MYIDQHLMTKCYERFHNRGRVSFGWEGFFGHNSAFILVAFRICEHKLEIQKTNVKKKLDRESRICPQSFLGWLSGDINEIYSLQTKLS